MRAALAEIQPGCGNWASRLWREVWTGPGPQLLDAALRGELIVARLRLLLLGSIVVVPVVGFLTHPESQEGRVALAVAIAGFVEAILVFLALKRRHLTPWIGFANSLFDVTLVSAALVTFLALDMPYVATNSRVIYPVYLVAITATALRYDSRICVVSGMAAVLQYGAIVLFAAHRRPLNTPADAPYSYGFFTWNDQIMRVILLAIATVLATVIVVRSRQLLLRSTRDFLTGLFNRGFFDERLKEEAERTRRLSRRLAVAMLDLDHFKEFNDAHGHRSGDELLCSIAGTLRKSFRTSDTVARYGGEEFAIIMPESEAEEALARMDEFRRSVEALKISLADRSATAGVTISIGLALWPGDGETVDHALLLADQRLYEAKRQGRNRIITGPPEPVASTESVSAKKPS